MDASIVAFGGGGDLAGEEEHIREVREAMDKVSSVPPLAGGVVQARIGNLSSANALRITLMGLLAKTMRKRIAYGRAIREMSEMALRVLDASGIFRTRERDRGIALSWPDPLPEDLREVVAVAEGKQRLGVANEVVLRELGYREAGSGEAGGGVVIASGTGIN
jgi:hypothetical protein